METTTIQVPAVTEYVTNGIDVFMNDVAQANQNQNAFWNSVAKFANNIIDSVKSCGDYFTYIIQVTDSLIIENKTPVFLGTMLSISLFFMILWFYRGK